MLRHSRRRRAAGFIWFLLVALPFLLFASVLAVDTTEAIIAHQEVTNLAQAAALAGSEQYVAGQTYLNAAQAQTAADQTWAMGRGHTLSSLQAAPLVLPGANVTVTALSQSGSSQPTEVQVTVRYKVRGLIFTLLLTHLLGASTISPVYTAQGSAFVCVPNSPGPTGGFCTQPQVY